MSSGAPATAGFARRDQWRALDGAQLYQLKLSVAAAADREMESRLIRRGYAMLPRADGNGAEVSARNALGYARDSAPCPGPAIGLSPDLALIDPTTQPGPGRRG